MPETQAELLDKDELIGRLRVRIGELIAEGITGKVENRKLFVIYKAADHVMMHLGMDGEIHNQHEAVQALNDRIHEFDDGTPIVREEEVNAIVKLEAEVIMLEARLATSERQRVGLAEELQRSGGVVQMARQIRIDQEKLARLGEGANLQLYCGECLKGAGDEADFKAGHLTECPYCHAKGPFGYSWDVAGVRGPN